MSDKLQQLDQRLEQTVGGSWGATSLAHQAFGTIQQFVVIARLGATVVRFLRRHPVITLGAVAGGLMLLKALGAQADESRPPAD